MRIELKKINVDKLLSLMPRQDYILKEAGITKETLRTWRIGKVQNIRLPTLEKLVCAINSHCIPNSDFRITKINPVKIEDFII